MTKEAPGLAQLILLGGTALLILWLIVIALAGQGFNLPVLLLQLVPLSLILPGLVRRQPRSAQWLCFLVLFFFTQSVLLMFTPGRFWLGLMECLICAVLFVSAIIFTRITRPRA